MKFKKLPATDQQQRIIILELIKDFWLSLATEGLLWDYIQLWRKNSWSLGILWKRDIFSRTARAFSVVDSILGVEEWRWMAWRISVSRRRSWNIWGQVWAKGWFCNAFHRGVHLLIMNLCCKSLMSEAFETFQKFFCIGMLIVPAYF